MHVIIMSFYFNRFIFGYLDICDNKDWYSGSCKSLYMHNVVLPVTYVCTTISNWVFLFNM